MPPKLKIAAMTGSESFDGLSTVTEPERAQLMRYDNLKEILRNGAPSEKNDQQKRFPFTLWYVVIALVLAGFFLHACYNSYGEYAANIAKAKESI